jgi:hypothetical protein
MRKPGFRKIDPGDFLSRDRGKTRNLVLSRRADADQGRGSKPIQFVP